MPISVSHISPVLSGTLPVHPYTDEFVGYVSSTGQHSNVVALATDERGYVIYISLVGYATSVSSALARVFTNSREKGGLGFEPYGQFEWNGPNTMMRHPASKYHQHMVHIPATREINQIAVRFDADISKGLTALATLPEPKSKGADIEMKPRYVFGNAAVPDLNPPVDDDIADRVCDSHGKLLYYVSRTTGRIKLKQEETPHPRSFLATLQALHVVFLQRDPHPEYVMQWANELWQKGIEQRLIVPVNALGIRCWHVSGNITQWNGIIKRGILDGRLPVTHPSLSLPSLLSEEIPSLLAFA